MPNAPTTGDSVIVGTWTYSGNPSATNKDAVRFLVGDTLDREKLVSDEEIAYALAQASNVVRTAAAWVCEHLAARFAREIDVTADDGRHDALSQRVQNYRTMAAELRKLEASEPSVAVKPYAGGISVADKDTQEDDDDRTLPSFTRDMWDNT